MILLIHFYYLSTVVMSQCSRLFIIPGLCILFSQCIGNISPEIYLFLGGDSPCKHLDKLSHKGISGAQVIYSWKRLESSENSYNFIGIFEDLKCLTKINKKLFIQIQDRSFTKDNIPVPNFLLDKKYQEGVSPQLDNPGEGKPKAVGWVAKQWVPAVRIRFQKLLKALGDAFDGKISGINLPETSIDIPNQSHTFCENYFSTVIQNMTALKNAFQHTNVVQYVNFFPCEWNNDKGYMQRLFTYAVKHHIGLGNPDTVPYRQGQMMNSYPFFHKYRKELSLTAIAIQEPDYTYINPRTGRTFTVPDLYGFAKNYLGADIIFWNIQEPHFTQELLPFLRNMSSNHKF